MVDIEQFLIFKRGVAKVEEWLENANSPARVASKQDFEWYDCCPLTEDNQCPVLRIIRPTRIWCFTVDRDVVLVSCSAKDNHLPIDTTPFDFSEALGIVVLAATFPNDSARRLLANFLLKQLTSQEWDTINTLDPAHTQSTAGGGTWLQVEA